MRSWSASRRVWWVVVPVAAVVVGLVAALAGWLPWATSSRDAARSEPTEVEPLGARQMALLDRVVPRPSCPRSAPVAAPKRDQLVVDHARVENGCLVVRGEVVPAARADRRIRELRADPGVVAADLRAVLVSEADPPKLDDLLDLGLPGDHLGNLKHLDDFDEEARRWHLWGLRRLQDDALRHAIDRSRPPVPVAVIDTDGIDREHPELRGVDITRYDGTPDADGDRGSHATAVASVIAARDDAVGFTGLMPHVRLLSARGNTNALADQIAWAVNQGARVVNLSVRAQCGLPRRDCGDQVTQAAVRSARAHGVVLVAASGNHRDEGSPVICPACYEGVVGVGGHDRGGKPNESMSVNGTVDISAPGTDVLVAGFVDTDAGARCPRGYTDEHDLWCTASGTSVAAPLVTAVVAWLLHQFPAAHPTQVEQAIHRGADPAAENVAGRRNDKYGWGYLNPLRAREELTRLLAEDRKDRKYVAYHSEDALAVLDPMSGRTRTLSLYGSPVGPKRLVVRWSPDGSRLAVLSTSGLLHWWDMTTLDMSSSDDAYDEATAFSACKRSRK